MSKTFDSQAYNRDLAACAHGVDLTIDLEGDVAQFSVPAKLATHFKAILQEAFEKHEYIGYVKRLEQIKKMVEGEDLQTLVNSTNKQLMVVLHRHRKLAPYEPGFKG